jgi:hypothetical protein
MSDRLHRTCQAPRVGGGGLCGNSLEGMHPLAKCCSLPCKARLGAANKAAQKKRARARQAEKRNGLEMIADAATNGTSTLDIARDVLREELRAYVNREALTEDVLADIQKMINYAPAAIQVLTMQLASEDETVAQRAAALILKYTMGNPSVAPPDPGKQPAQLQVVFGVPERGNGDTAVDAEVVETERTCGDCGLAKPESEFVGKSPRCTACFERMQLDVRAKFAPQDPTKPRPDDHAT